MKNTTEIGRYGEKCAARFLRKNRYRILERNRHQSHNEIDIIARDKSCIVFAEVKTRSVDAGLYSDYGSPASAVTKGKQHRTIAAARTYLSAHLQPRLDVIEVYLDKENGKVLKIHHIPNAFGVG